MSTVRSVVLLASPTPTPSPAVTVIVAGLGQHDAFDVWASIVLPAVLGAGTVLVSIVSLVVARRALKVSQSVAERDHLRHESAQRQARYDIKGKFERWFLHELVLGEIPSTDTRYGERTNLKNETRTALEVMSDKSGLELMRWLDLQLIRHRAGPRADRDEVLFAGMKLISEWALDPAAVEWVQDRSAMLFVLGAASGKNTSKTAPESARP